MADRGATLAQLRELVDRARPVTLAHERSLPVLPALSPLLPGGALRRGSVVRVAGGHGATTLALALLAGPTSAGSWAACVGAEQLGWSAAADVGVELTRTVVVRPTARTWATVVAALVDAFDLVVCGPELRPGAAEVRRLAGRARERGAVLVALGDPRRVDTRWDEADVHLSVERCHWRGTGAGWGHLRGRRATVTATGRGDLSRPRRVDLWLPGPDGVAAAELADVVVPFAPRSAAGGPGGG